MDPRALELLELPAILDRLAAEAASEPGKDRSLALVPSAEPDEVDRLQSLTREAIDLFERSAEPDVADVRDVRHAAEVAARGSVLDTAALRSVATSIDAATAARARDRDGRRRSGARGVGGRCRSRARARLGADRARGGGRRLGSARRRLAGASAPPAGASRGSRTDHRAAPRARARPVAPRAPVRGLRHRARRPARARAPRLRPRRGAGHRPRQLGLRADAVRRAVRRRRGLQPPARGRERRAGGGRADPARALACGRRPGGRHRQPRAGDRRDRSRLRVRPPLAALAGNGGDAQPQRRAARGAAPAARSRDGRADRPRARRASRRRHLRAEHRRQDRRAEDGRPGGAPAPVRAAAPGRARRAARVRPGPGRHRRRAVHRDEPLDVLGARPQPRDDPRERHRPVARSPRRARRGNRPGRGSCARPVPARAARRPGTPHDRDEPLPRAEGVGERVGTTPRTPRPASTPRRRSRSTASRSDAPARPTPSASRRASAFRPR